MKRCPECRRDYYDDSLLYCLDDGSALLDGPASADEPATAGVTARPDAYYDEWDYRRGATVQFDKGVGGRYLELRIVDREQKLQPEFEIRQWE